MRITNIRFVHNDDMSCQYVNDDAMQVFGVALDELLRRESERAGAPRRVPAFLVDTFAWLLEHGCNATGLFRLSANQDDLDATRELVDAGASPQFSVSHRACAYVCV